MVVLLYMICGVAGVAVGGLLGVIWFSGAVLGGWTPPTPDQMWGLALLCGAVSTIGSMILTAFAVVFDR